MSTAQAPATLEELQARYNKLLRLRDQIDGELDAVAEGLRMHKAWKGQPRKANVMSSAEAKRAHAAYASGDTTVWAREGERQYQRESKRRNYHRRKKAEA